MRGFHRKRKNVFYIFLFIHLGLTTRAQEEINIGATELSPSRSEYFSWINNTNEGATEEQTKINLAFFEWLQNEYGMKLDIYAFDAGAVDGKRFYGSMKSVRFQCQFPNGFGPISERAGELGIRLGLWGGPDGFGNTKEEEQERTEQMVSLCRDYNFELFKFDAVCGRLEPEREGAFIEMMKQCRKHSPDLILLDHRLFLHEGQKYTTTFLWEGQEMYIDVSIRNRVTAPHHRAGALSRGLPPDLARLTEDHGVCISSYNEYWDDDLILQAFNRSLILAPQIYGNPWFLRDEEYPKLARIFNLHRNYRDILVHGDTLPQKQYGPFAVSRGNDEIRFITLRNLKWNKKTYKIDLDKSIGLSNKGSVFVRQFHPTERVLGIFDYGTTIQVDVDPFRSCLIIASTKELDEPAVTGADFQVIRNMEGNPLEIELLGMPGSETSIQLVQPERYSRISAEIDGKKLLEGKNVVVKFPGEKLNKGLTRKVDDCSALNDSIKFDWKPLYEATIFSADNNALEVRSIQKSGWSSIPEVRAAQEAFFNQDVFMERGIWDKNLFDGDMQTGYWQTKKYNIDHSVNGGCFRLDLGEIDTLDFIKLKVGDDFSLQPLLTDEGNFVDVSTDLKKWERLTYIAGKEMSIDLKDKPFRYLRFKEFPQRILEIEGYKDGASVDRSKWKGSNLFAHPSTLSCKKVWKSTFSLDEIAPNSYLCIAVNGVHGQDGVYAAAVIDGKMVGAPDRSPSYRSNTWEYLNIPTDSNYTYYIPLNVDDINKEIEVYVMAFDEKHLDLYPEVWINTYPIPYKKIGLVLDKTPD